MKIHFKKSGKGKAGVQQNGKILRLIILLLFPQRHIFEEYFLIVVPVQEEP